MALIMEKLKDFNYWMEGVADPRVDGWYWLQSPVPVLLLVMAYLLVVQYGPKLMENRKPFDLRSIIIGYNFIMVLWSAYTGYEIFITAYQSNYSLTCQPVDYSRDELAIRMLDAVYWFWLSKVIELLDTIFFILRKKNSQVSFLHVYHHSTMVLQVWVSLKFVGGGQRFMIGFLNSMVHVVMYSYYALAAVGPHMQKYLWWKKYITRLQLAQFVIMMTHDLYNMSTVCSFPWWQSFNSACHTFTVFILFALFYRKTYTKKKLEQGKDKHKQG